MNFRIIPVAVAALLIGIYGCDERIYRVHGFRDATVVSKGEARISMRVLGESRIVPEDGRGVDITQGPYRIVVNVSGPRNHVVDALSIKLDDVERKTPSHTVEINMRRSSEPGIGFIGTADLVALEHRRYNVTISFRVRNNPATSTDSVTFMLEPYTEETTAPLSEELKRL